MVFAIATRFGEARALNYTAARLGVIFLILLLGGAMLCTAFEVAAQPTLKARYVAEPTLTPVAQRDVPPPSFEGKVMIRLPDGRWVDIQRPEAPFTGMLVPPAGADIFLADGSENALAINTSDGDNLVAVLNQGFSNSASLLNSTNGNVNWTARTFPNGGGTFTGSPFDPWANHGNSADELFATLIRRDTDSDNTHCVIARSTDGGATWPLFFEATRDVFQDREMVDVDRTQALGGGSGTTHDDKVYLCYDNFGVEKAGYVASYLQVVSSAGAALTEVTISTSASFNGGKLQPIAGTQDGQVYLMGLSTSGSGANRILDFHEVTGAGASTTLNKSSMTFPTTGQQLGTTTRYGVNGHRVNSHMAMDIDLTSGPKRGTLYVISNRNPNQGDVTKDQGDVFLSMSTDGASSWSSAEIPGQTSGKTQFFSMLDVDENGWIHVAYYQNETGSTDGGVLNASTAKLYYTVSKDGGLGWAPHEQVNDAANTLDYDDPPPDLSGSNYYLIGDYCQIKATGTGANTKAYVFWTGYDKDRGDTNLNDKKERSICTTMTPNPNLPPTADAGANQTVECTSSGGTQVMLDGTGSSDPENDPLSYLWAGAPFDDPTSPTPTGTFQLGTTTVTLTVSDGMFQNSDTVDITIVDTTPPVITCPADTKVECSDFCGTPATDPQLAPFFAGVSATDICDDDVDITDDRLICFPLGTTPVKFTATDDSNNSASCTAIVTVEDTTPPEITVELDRDVLWPPNHKMAEICAMVEVTDICDPAPTFVLTSITSNEPDNGRGDGNTINDIQEADIGTPDEYFLLRSERSGRGDGRKYTIIYTAMDASGNTADDTVCVRVPHDQSGNAMASLGFNDDGTELDLSYQRFVIVVPSTAELDATKLNTPTTYVGNAKGVLKPVETIHMDLQGDGLSDLVLYYSSADALALAEASMPEGDGQIGLDEAWGSLGLHYRDEFGEEFLVSSIFGLGPPVQLMPIMPPMGSDDEEPERELPNVTALTSIHPNPFNPTTTIEFHLFAAERVSLRVYDTRGLLVRTLADETRQSGVYSVLWDGRDNAGRQVATGVYFARFVAGDVQTTRKMVMLK